MNLSRSLNEATESPICKAWVPLSNARFAHTHYLLETLHHKWRVSYRFYVKKTGICCLKVLLINIINNLIQK